MFSSGPTTRVVLRYVFGAIGAALLVFLVVYAGPQALLKNARAVGWGLALVIALAGVGHLVKAWAWRLTLPSEVPYPFSRIFGLRLVSEAIAQLGLPGVVAGEATRVALLGSDVPLASKILSVTLDRGLFIACGAIVTVCGISAGLLSLTLTNALRLYAALFAIVLLGIVFGAVLFVSKGFPVLSAPARALGRVPWIGRWVQTKQSLISSVEEQLLQFRRERPSAFWGAVALNFVCHGLAITEVFLILLFMKCNVSFVGALVLESLTKLINTAGALIPGNLGTYEGGTMAIGTLFGLSATAGLTLGLCRRLRGIFWALVGVVSFFVVSRSATPRKESGSPHRSHLKQVAPVAESTAPADSGSFSKTTAAILFVENYDSREYLPELAHVGTLPIILRAILQLESLHPNRIIVVADRMNGTILRRELLRTGRLPARVEWFEPDRAERSLPRLISEVAEDAHRVFLVSGNTTCHPCVYQMLKEWDGLGDALELSTGSQSVGIRALSRQAALRIARDCPPYVSPIQLSAWFKRTYSVVFKQVDADLWQVVNTPQDRLIAERKLDRWLVKPTDGLFAQMNRRMSIPISRQLIKFPITPNMVTLFTLGVSFLAGLFFARDGYGNSLLGALLSVWASILDGCDGEVARLKLQASDFGCWLETICDYLYYLFIFGGMSLGLAKSRGTDAYFVWGGVLFFGAVGSFLAVGSLRQRFASSHPERFLHLWQKKADGQKTNPLIYLARHTEFIIRRCFLPYALLGFAVLNLTRFFFIGSAVGANLVWIIALYTSWKLSARSASLPQVNAKQPHVSGALLLSSHDAD